MTGGGDFRNIVRYAERIWMSWNRICGIPSPFSYKSLSEEEAFLIAKRRCGTCKELHTEFSKSEPLRSKLKRVVLDDRKFVGCLLLMSSIASLVLLVSANTLIPSDSIESILRRWQADENMVTTFGFLLPPLQDLIAPLLSATVLLALFYLWLVRKETKSFVKRTTSD